MVMHRWVVLSSMTPCNLLLAQRLYYLFQRAPRIRLLLISLFTCELMAHITIVTLLATHTQLQDTRLISGALGCSNTVINGGSLIIISAIPDLFLTCIYFGFAFVKYLEHIRERSSMSSLRAIRDSGDLAPLLSLLFRDGVLFYALYTFDLESLPTESSYLPDSATVLTNGFTLGIFHNRLLSGVAFPWITAIYSIAVILTISGIFVVSDFLLFWGNTNEALGIYNEGTELRVNAPIQLDELDELPVLTISWSDGASEHKK
ncbi:hypothetical protein K439DRAFT_1624641 [Ramaria rubella]|nr:hypothetical protein K439DRAFT_1624641 [Ramaria rubella]